METVKNSISKAYKRIYLKRKIHWIGLTTNWRL